jgi:hypothetical protein
MKIEQNTSRINLHSFSYNNLVNVLEFVMSGSGTRRSARLAGRDGAAAVPSTPTGGASAARDVSTAASRARAPTPDPPRNWFSD